PGAALQCHRCPCECVRYPRCCASCEQGQSPRLPGRTPVCPARGRRRECRLWNVHSSSRALLRPCPPGLLGAEPRPPRCQGLRNLTPGRREGEGKGNQEAPGRRPPPHLEEDEPSSGALRVPSGLRPGPARTDESP
ncbi:hypothetical protein NDU88_004200, partial [Pleurodeles waltl]